MAEVPGSILTGITFHCWIFWFSILAKYCQFCAFVKKKKTRVEIFLKPWLTFTRVSQIYHWNESCWNTRINIQVAILRVGLFSNVSNFFIVFANKTKNLVNPTLIWWQESPSAWTQEAYRPPRSKYSLCCSVWREGRGTYPGWGVPALDGGGVTYLGWGRRGTPIALKVGIPLSAGR